MVENLRCIFTIFFKSNFLCQIRNRHGRKPRVYFFHNFHKIFFIIFLAPLMRKTQGVFFHNFHKIIFISNFLPPLIKCEKEREKFSLGVRWSKIRCQIRSLHSRKPRGYFFCNFHKFIFCIRFFTSKNFRDHRT